MLNESTFQFYPRDIKKFINPYHRDEIHASLLQTATSTDSIVHELLKLCRQLLKNYLMNNEKYSITYVNNYLLLCVRID